MARRHALTLGLADQLLQQTPAPRRPEPGSSPEEPGFLVFINLVASPLPRAPPLELVGPGPGAVLASP